MPATWKDKELTPQQASFATAYARVGEPRVAALLADYRGKGSNSPTMLAKDPNIIKAVEAHRFRSMSENLVPLALKVMQERLEGPECRARDEMARFVYKEWKDEHASIAGPDGVEDIGNASAEQLSRMIAELELQQAALETLASSKAKDVSPSTDVIAEADTITDIDPFG